MYAQFQSYQGGGTTAVSTQQPSLVWNGHSWVPSQSPSSSVPGAYSSSGVSTYQQPSRQQIAVVSQNESQTYTQYYHQWSAFVVEQTKVVERSNPIDKPKEEDRLRWYKYYVDMSSRAAHWFHNNPNSPPPFELPPAPHSSSFAAQPIPGATSQQHPTAQPQVQTPKKESPDSLKRYVDRCLTQCKTSDQKAAMLKMIESKIQQAIQSGTLHTTDWDRQPLLNHATGEKINCEEISLHDSYFKTPASSISIKSSANGLPTVSPGQWTGYYGPSSANTPLTSPDTKSTSLNESSLAMKFSMSVVSSKKRKNPSSHDSLSLPSTGTSHDYYRPSKSPNTSSRQQPRDQSTNYYGPPSPASSSTKSEDFISVPSANKHRTIQRKGSGFNQSSGALDHRAKRFAGRGGLSDAAKEVKDVPGFERYMGKSTIGGSNIQLDEIDYENMKVKGTCLKLEKEYLRLTAPPRAELVRPQPILEQHLRNLKAARKDASNRRDYIWFCSQLKAVRQDCTVQHIQNSFAVDVYETHARIALEEGDLNEYNQCQTQLKELYRKLEHDPQAVANRNEFVAYRLLYYIFLTGNQKYDGGSSDLFKIMDGLKAEERADPAIRHALSVRVAVSEFDYHSFFSLREVSPNMGIFLMDRIVPSMRYHALLRICKAYRPSVDVAFVLTELGFESITDGLEDGRKWLESCGCILVEDKTVWSTKDTVIRESDIDDRRSSLI